MIFCNYINFNCPITNITYMDGKFKRNQYSRYTSKWYSLAVVLYNAFCQLLLTFHTWHRHSWFIFYVPRRKLFVIWLSVDLFITTYLMEGNTTLIQSSTIADSENSSLPDIDSLIQSVRGRICPRQEETTWKFCQPKLLPLKTFTVEKLEKLQKEAEEQLKKTSTDL